MNETNKPSVGRKVINTNEDFDWNKLEEEAQGLAYGEDAINLLKKKDELPKKVKKKKKKIVKKYNPKTMSADEIIERHHKSQKAQRLFKIRVRAAITLLLTIIVVLSVALLTPIFNIKNITISGNRFVTASQVSELVGDMKGTNIFLAGKKEIKKKLRTIRYVNDIEITKTLFPPTIDIAVTEYIPSGYIQVGGKFLVLDRSIYVIDDNATISLEDIMCITGVKVEEGEMGKTLVTEEKEKEDILKTLLTVMCDEGLINNIVSTDFSDLDNITMNYDNRLNVIFGSHIDLDRKLRLFGEMINSQEIGPEDKGEIYFSTAGKAIYTP